MDSYKIWRDLCTGARDGEGGRTSSSCAEWQTANLAIAVYAQYPDQESVTGQIFLKNARGCGSLEFG